MDKTTEILSNYACDLSYDHLPPEVITVIEDGGFYGWPVAYGYQVAVDFGISQYRTRFFH